MGMDLIPTRDIPDEAFDGIEGLVDGGHCLAGRIFDYVLRELGIDDSLWVDHGPRQVAALHRKLAAAEIPERYHRPHTYAEYGSAGLSDDRTLIPHTALYLPLLRWLEVLVRYRSGFRVDV